MSRGGIVKSYDTQLKSELIAQALGGKPISDLAKRYKIPTTTIHGWVKHTAKGVLMPLNTKLLKGARIVRRMSPELKQQIVNEYQTSTAKEVAARHSVSEGNIHAWAAKLGVKKGEPTVKLAKTQLGTDALKLLIGELYVENYLLRRKS